jgi:hypothetical protein
MEVTKWLKHSISVSRIGDSASVQAVTRVHVRFDERDVETEPWLNQWGTARRKRRQQICST